MIRIITIALALLAITVLLASSISVLFPSSETPAKSPGPADDRQNQLLYNREDGKGDRPFPPDAAASRSLGVLVDAVPRSPLAEKALATQVSNQVSGFVEGLVYDEDRRAELMEAFSQAYKDAAALGASRNSLNTQSQDPNFVVNSMAKILESEELSELELYLENTSKQQFLETVVPQVEIISASLPTELKQQLLDSYFAQHYAATNPHGSLAPQSSAGFLKAQLDAVRATRTQLQNSLPKSEFELANQFLNEQEAGLDLGLGLFELNQ